MTDADFEKVKQANEHLTELKRFEAFLASHHNLSLVGDCKMKPDREVALIPSVVCADWLSSVRALLTIAQTRFNKIEIHNINN